MAVGSGVVSAVLTPLAAEVALRRGILDWPGPRKAQREAVPYLGGAAILMAVSLVAVGLAAGHRPGDVGMGTLGLVLGLGAGVATLGLVDDLRGLPMVPRALIEGSAAAVLFFRGTRAHLPVPAPVDALVTVIWVVGITNAVNLLDNMDGLAAGVAGLAAAGLAVVGVLSGNALVALLAAAVAGGAAGFLRHNFVPARIYLGDAGSLFLGFLLAALCLRLRSGGHPPVGLLVPLLVMGVPIFDTGFVVATRALGGLNPFPGQRDHPSHRLVALGLPVPTVVLLAYASAAVTVGAALVAWWAPGAPAYGVAAALVVLAAALGARLARVRLPAP